MHRTLSIDDERNLGTDRVARTFDDGIKALRDEGPWYAVWFDHDLGEIGPQRTGYDILLWLEQHPQYWPERIHVVSLNPVGKAAMCVVAQRIMRQKNGL